MRARRRRGAGNSSSKGLATFVPCASICSPRLLSPTAPTPFAALASRATWQALICSKSWIAALIAEAADRLPLPPPQE
jgi:hypothetical protein